MALTFRHGKAAFFSVTSTAAVAIALSSALDDITMARTMTPADVTHFGNNDHNFVVGLRGATFTCAGIFASTIAKKIDGLLGSTAGGSFVFGPESTATGRRKYTGSCLLTKLDYKAPVGDKVSMACDFQVTGSVTATTF